MTITKQTTIDQKSADEHGNVMYRVATRILEDGEMLTQTFFRSSLSPGQDLTGVPAEIVTFCTAVWTPENVAAWSANFITLQETERLKQVAAAQATEAARTAAEAAAQTASIPAISAIATMRQAREALIRRGFFATVDNYIAAMPGIEGDIARNEWEMSQTVERDRPLTLAMAALLGMNQVAMDEFYAFALTL